MDRSAHHPSIHPCLDPDCLQGRKENPSSFANPPPRAYRPQLQVIGDDVMMLVMGYDDIGDDVMIMVIGDDYTYDANYSF